MRLLFTFLKLWYFITFVQKGNWTIEFWFKNAIIYIDGKRKSSKNTSLWQHIAIVKEKNETN